MYSYLNVTRSLARVYGNIICITSLFAQITIYEELVTEGGLTFVQSILELCSVETMDSGEYSCIVESGATSDMEVTQLTVADLTSVCLCIYIYTCVYACV